MSTLSIKSSTPPIPGNKAPESLASALRLTIDSVESLPGTSDSGQWTVIGTVRKLGPASIMTASSAA